MAVLALVGITGMYLSQVRRNGVLGLVGYLVLGVGYLLIACMTYVATFVLPQLVAHRSRLRRDVITAIKGGTPDGDIGPLALVLQVQGYLLPGRRTHPRRRALPGSGPRPVGHRAPRRRWRHHDPALGAARRLLPAAGLPQRRRHDRSRLLPVGDARRAPRRAPPRPSTARPSRPSVRNEPAPPQSSGQSHPAARRSTGRAGALAALATRDDPGHRRLTPPRRAVRRSGDAPGGRPLRRVTAARRRPHRQRHACSRSWVPFSSRRRSAAADPVGTAGRDGCWWSPGWGWRSRRSG